LLEAIFEFQVLLLITMNAFVAPIGQFMTATSSEPRMLWMY